ncbi:hypothetical protein F5Y12DRAFT_714730 [Xylaria sp. FL1777]|nr:hypothetical protein F5Y12DRAFT_714730 [Xylaria sp. FL1777]
MQQPSPFSEAVHKFANQHTKKRQPGFIQDVIDSKQRITAEEVQTTMMKLEEESLHRTSSKMLRAVFDSVWDYDGVISVLGREMPTAYLERLLISITVQADPLPSALIWGGLKAFLECFRRYNDLLDKLGGQLKKLTRCLTRLKECEDLFNQSDEMRDLLQSSYLGIIRFWALVEEQCPKSRFAKGIKSLTSSTLKILDDIVSQIENDSANIEKWIPIASERIRRHEHQDIVNETRQAGADLKEILRQQHQEVQEARRRDEIHRREEVRKRREEAWSWVVQGDNDALQNGGNNWRHDRQLLKIKQGTGTWLFEDGRFSRWQSPVLDCASLWLRGGPGAGKSVLCAHAIQHLQAGSPDFTVVFYYFDFNENDPLLTIYKDIAKQLFCQLYPRESEISQDVYEITGGKFGLDSLKKLIRILVAESRTTFLFLDGLDEEMSIGERWQAVKNIVSFSLELAKSEDSPLKLWCSSQDRYKIRVLLSGCESIELGASTNNKDIETFLQIALEDAELGEMDQDIKTKVLNKLQKKVDGNFLWAAFMVDTIADSPSHKDLARVLEIGLPQDFENYLKKKIATFKPEQFDFLSKVFSCLAFANRPLFMEELCEAVEIFDCKTGEDLMPRCQIFKSRLQDLCAPFVSVHSVEINSGERQRVTLSHSSVRKFLDKNQSILSSEEDLRISPTRLALAIFKYLRQPRYSRLLREDEASFIAAQKESILEHPSSRILCQVLAPPFGQLTEDEEPQIVRSFLRWFTKGHPLGKSIQRQYQAAIFEWGYYLNKFSFFQGEYPGQLGRCWWASLGKGNFLYRVANTFKSFTFHESLEGKSWKSDVRWETMSASGTSLDLYTLDLSDEHGHGAHVLHERWTILPGRRPKLHATSTLSISNDDLMRCKRQPNKTSAARLSQFEATEGGKVLRIGTNIYTCSMSTPFEYRRLDLAENQMGVIQEIGCNDRFFAIASRNRFDEGDLATLDDDFGDAERQTNKKPSVDDYESDSSDSTTSSSDSSSSSANRETERKESRNQAEPVQPRSRSRDISQDKTKSWLGQISDRPSDSIDKGDGGSRVLEFDEWSEKVESNSAYESWSEGSTAPLSDEIEDEELWHDFEFADSNDCSDLSINENSDANMGHLDDLSEPDSLSLSDVSFPAKSQTRDRLGSSRKSSVESFVDDPGDPDFSSGSNGSDGSESGSDESDSEDTGDERLDLLLGPEPLIDHNGPICEIRVFGIPAIGQKAPYIFRFTQRSAMPLYSSPPTLHPTEDLLVWPLGANEILFANFSQKKYFIRVIRTTYEMSCQISVTCRFSPCGLYLHIASLDGVVMKTDDSSKTLGLRLHVSTHRLSQRKPARSPPRLVYRTSVNLKQRFSVARKLSVFNMPCALTWTESHVYLTESDEKLRVYRIPLFREVHENEKIPNAPEGVLTNTGDPGKKPSGKADYSAHVILGSQNLSNKSKFQGRFATVQGLERTPPQGVHLTPEQLGDWESVELDKDETTKLNMTAVWKGGQLLDRFKKFDHSEDCDIVPFLEP